MPKAPDIRGGQDVSWDRLLDLGLTAAKAAHVRGVSIKAAHQAARARGRKFRRPPASPRQIANARAVYRKANEANAKPRTVLGKEYPSLADAARALGVPKSTLRHAIARGDEERVVRGIVVLGRRYPSNVAVGKAFGVCDSHVSAMVARGQEALDAAALRWRARRDAKAKNARTTVSVFRNHPGTSGETNRINVSLPAMPWDTAAPATADATGGA